MKSLKQQSQKWCCLKGIFKGHFFFFLPYGIFKSNLENKIIKSENFEDFKKKFLSNLVHSSILHPTLFLLYINDLPVNFICNIAIYGDDTTLYSKCDQASDLWQLRELASELESNLPVTMV